MECPSCKIGVPEKARFCPQCGNAVTESGKSREPSLTDPSSGKPLSLAWVYIGWVVLYTVASAQFASGPYWFRLVTQAIQMLAVSSVCLAAACIGGLMYKLAGKQFPWKRIFESTVLFSGLVGGIIFYVAQHASR